MFNRHSKTTWIAVSVPNSYCCQCLQTGKAAAAKSRDHDGTNNIALCYQSWQRAARCVRPAEVGFVGPTSISLLCHLIVHEAEL